MAACRRSRAQLKGGGSISDTLGYLKSRTEYGVGRGLRYGGAPGRDEFGSDSGGPAYFDPKTASLNDPRCRSIFFCSIMMEYTNCSGRGGQPGT